MKTINIMGTCVCRDIFGYHENDGGYKINRYVFEVSPESAISRPWSGIDYNEVISMCKDIEMENFRRRSVSLDLTGSAFQYLFGEPSDYLVVDMNTCRLGYFEFNGGILTKNGYIRNGVSVHDEMRRLFAERYNQQKGKAIDDYEAVCKIMDKYIPQYCERIQKVYPKEKIIFVEIEPENLYIDRKGFVKGLTNKKWISTVRMRLRYANSIAKKCLEGCHIIEFPAYCMSYSFHKWGACFSHFVPEYYDYGLEAVNEIVRGGHTKSEEEKLLRELKDKYSRLMHDKYLDNFYKTFDLMVEARELLKQYY